MALPREARPDELVSVDLEMFGMEKLHRADGTFASMSIAYLDGDAYLITDEKDIRPALDRIEQGLWVFQNSLFDLRILRRYTDVPQRFVHDTMIVEMDLFGGWFSRFSLDNLSRRWLSLYMDKEVRKQFEKAAALTPEMEEYAIQDAKVTVAIAEKQREYIYRELDGDFRWYTEIDMPAIWAVLDMQPVLVDVDAWLAYAEIKAVEALERQEALGFNVNSHAVVRRRIEEKLGRKIKNTNEKKTLTPLIGKMDPNHPAAVLIREVIAIRRLRKAVETYGPSWLKDVEDGYVYPSWRVVGAETGRMSCANPNMQNIPVRTDPTYRTFFPAKPGHVVQVSDVSQQEPGFNALLSGDRVLLDEIEKGIKGHQVTADLFGVDYDTGKAINLGLNYGMTEWGLSATVGISKDAASDGIRARDRRYRTLTAWRKSQISKARRQYKVHTVTGRPVWVNPYNQSGQWERNAQNGPIQGSAADHTKLAFVKLHQMCADHGVPFKVTHIIHDEIVQNVPLPQAELYDGLLSVAWEEATRELAPGINITVDVAQGQTWGVK